MTLVSCTVSANTGTVGPGSGTTGGYGFPRWMGGSIGGICSIGSLTMRNCVVAGNSGLQIAGSGIVESGNFTGPASPLLGPLADNGGPVDTMAPLPGSPLLDQGSSEEGLSSDQRLGMRTFDDPALANAYSGDGTDIGAVEAQPLWSGEEELTPREVSGMAPAVRLRAAPNRLYRIEFTDDLKLPFTALGPPAETGALGVIETPGPGPLPPKRFYRAVRVR